MPIDINEIVSEVIGTNNSRNLSDISEGTPAGNSKVNIQQQASAFVRMVVLDVISDPNTDLFDESINKRDAWENLGVSNLSYSEKLPRNTIIAKRIGDKNARPMFVFPFFPSHLSIPCKPGECVWVMLENPSNIETNMGFWFCRVVDSHLSDDVNHSHPARSMDSSFNPGTKDIANQSENIFYELRNGPSIGISGQRATNKEKVLLFSEDEDIFEKLVIASQSEEYLQYEGKSKETMGSELMTYEPVPRFRKRPGDVALEGSNNTLVVLGTDRKDDLKKTKFKESSGTIDIVAGRGQTKETYGKSVETTSIKGSENGKGEKIHEELNKSPRELKKTEGDVDYINDRSRILVSQRTKIDDKFNLKSYNESIQKTDPKEKDSDGGDAAIVIKSDKIRLIARSDVEIIVTGFKEKPSQVKGINYKEEEISESKSASILIKSNGDIVFTPSSEGVVKLGGDDASLAVLCEEAIISAPGTVTCPSGILDSMGGIQGLGTPGQGQFAKKVLLK